MGIRKFKPTTPGRRGASQADYSEVTRSRPEKALTALVIPIMVASLSSLPQIEWTTPSSRSCGRLAPRTP